MYKLLLLILSFSHLAYAGSSDRIDPSFGVNGRVETDISLGTDKVEVIAIQIDGKIIAAGITGKKADFSIVRYYPEGQLDPSFGKQGITVTDLGGDDRVFGLGIQGDGKIVVAGFTRKGSKSDMALARYTLEGHLDTTFGASGIRTTDIGVRDEIHYLAIQPDNRIVVAGFVENRKKSDFLVARYTANGALDNTFGARGWITTDFSRADYLYGVALQRDGKIVVAGSIEHSETQEDCVAARYQSDGRLDTNFGNGGLVNLTASKKQDVCSSVIAQNDGKILVAGFAEIPPSPHNTDFLLARLMPDGQRDNQFGTRGITTIDFQGGIDAIHALAIKPDGTIIVGGDSAPPATFDKTTFSMAVFYIDGRLDTSFGANGRAIFPSTTPNRAEATSLILQEPNRVILGGSLAHRFSLVGFSVE